MNFDNFLVSFLSQNVLIPPSLKILQGAKCPNNLKSHTTEGVKLVYYQPHKISLIYSKLYATSLCPITLTVFSNTTK